MEIKGKMKKGMEKFPIRCRHRCCCLLRLNDVLCFQSGSAEMNWGREQKNCTQTKFSSSLEFHPSWVSSKKKKNELINERSLWIKIFKTYGEEFESDVIIFFIKKNFQQTFLRDLKIFILCQKTEKMCLTKKALISYVQKLS